MAAKPSVPDFAGNNHAFWVNFWVHFWDSACCQIKSRPLQCEQQSNKHKAGVMMTDQQPIYVNEELFLGRVEEQAEFRRILPGVINPPPGEVLPYIVLLYGDGGIGKTTLARRFRDIAETEPSFEGRCQSLWVDWETERGKHPGLQVGREHISVETVLDRIHANALLTNDKWGRHFKKYQEMLKKRQKVEQEAAKALTERGEPDELAHTLVGATISGLAKVIRMALPIGEAGEKIAQSFLEVGVNVGVQQAAVLRGQIETRLKARLDGEQYQLFLNPHEQLARALGEGLQQIARSKPLLIFFDTYEIIDRVDLWIREVMREAGSRLLWVVAGRQNLALNRQGRDGYFRGYVDDFPRRLLTYDMLQLAQIDLQTYFADVVPQRPLAEEEAFALSQATRGIPLAIKTAATLWKKDVSLTEIVGNTTATVPHQEIVEEMTRRYMLHVVEESPDRFALYALAWANGNLDILQAMLAPEWEGIDFDLTSRLSQLRNDYAAVHLSDARLHDEPAAFLNAYLSEDIQRRNSRLQQMNERAAVALQLMLMKIERDLLLLEEQAQDEDWVQIVLDLTRILFWIDERRGWQWFVPRFIESLAYSKELGIGLLNIVEMWHDKLSIRGKRLLEIFQTASRATSEDEIERDSLTGLENLASSSVGWLKGEGEVERRSILDWFLGTIYFRQERYQESLLFYKDSLRGLPQNGILLAEQLAESFSKLGWEFGLKFSRTVPSEDALYCLRQAVALSSKNSKYHVGLGVMHLGLQEYQEAILAIQRGIEINNKAAWALTWLGIVYSQMSQYEAANAAYQEALTIDPRYIRAYTALGNFYFQNGHYDEAITVLKKAIDIDPYVYYPHTGLGHTYSRLGRYDEAIGSFQTAIALNSTVPYAQTGLGFVYRSLGRYEEAIAIFLEATILDPTFVGSYIGLGSTCYSLGHYEEAIAAFQQAIALAPKSAGAHSRLGNVYAILGRTEEAIAAYQQAITLDPKFAFAHLSLATSYRKMGRDEDYKAAIEMARPHIINESAYFRACFEAICDNVEEALALLKQAVANAPGLYHLAQKDPDFDFIRDDPRFQALIGEPE